MGRRPCCEKVGLNRGGWSALEDQILTNYIKANGEGKWRDLPKKAGLKRCGKSCRLRWLNYLNPKIIRGNITQEEEELIINLHKHLGNRWSLIAGRLPGRTDNEIKNYWNTILCRKVHGEQVVPQRKPRKKTHVKNSNSNSNSVPPRRVTVQIMCPVSEHIVTDPQAVPSETADAIITPSEPVTLQENSADFIDQIMQNMDSIEESVPPLINFNEQCCRPQELAWSQKMNAEFMGDIMQNQANIEGPQSPGSENCYTREDCDEFMGDIMQPIANLKSPPSLVYEKCYHDLMSDLGSEEICMPEMDEYFRYSYQDILSDLTVTLEDSMFDHWMGDTPKEENNTFDLGSSATLF